MENKMTKKDSEKSSDSPNKEEVTCFVIMPISDQADYEPNHFTLVYQDIIIPAIKEAGMVPIRADETKNTNLIQLDIIRKVIESDIAICDMSSKNPNVFYELGMRQAFDKPTVLMIDDNTTPPFDVSSLRYVNYKKGLRYRDVKDAISSLAHTLRDTYDKKDDPSEINSLIRLMGLTLPAKLNHEEITAEDRTAIQLSEISTAINNISKQQNSLANKVAEITSNRFPEAGHRVYTSPGGYFTSSEGSDLGQLNINPNLVSDGLVVSLKKK